MICEKSLYLHTAAVTYHTGAPLNAKLYFDPPQFAWITFGW